jgi:hypothetical protein
MRFAVVSALLLTCTGCGLFTQLHVEPLATSFQRPSNVAAYVAVTDADEPLTELSPSNFRVYENEQLVPGELSRLTLLDRNVAAAHHALLLVDMSGAQSAEARGSLAKAALGFIQKISTQEPASVFAFDGSPNITPVGSVARGGQLSSLPALESFSVRDSSRNLNGAVVAALAKLDSTLSQTGRAIKVGTLVVFANGPDVAGRVSDDKLRDALSASGYDVIAIGVAERADGIAELGRRGLIRSQSPDTLPIAFEEAAEKAQSELEKHYLVAYCSPARAGSRRLRLQVVYTTKEGKEHTGDFETDFDAKGFGAGCNPETPPHFTLKAKPAAKSEQEGTKAAGAPAEQRPALTSDSKPADEAEDAPVAPPEKGGYAK